MDALLGLAMVATGCVGLWLALWRSRPRRVDVAELTRRYGQDLRRLDERAFNSSGRAHLHRMIDVHWAGRYVAQVCIDCDYDVTLG